jgi:chromosome segregation ATPase
LFIVSLHASGVRGFRRWRQDSKEREEMGGQQELEELEERNRGLQHDLELVKAGEQEAARTRESLERQRAVLREEVAAATSRLERATQIRNTCKRLSNLEGRLNPLGAQPGATARRRRARALSS